MPGGVDGLTYSAYAHPMRTDADKSAERVGRQWVFHGPSGAVRHRGDSGRLESESRASRGEFSVMAAAVVEGVVAELEQCQEQIAELTEQEANELGHSAGEQIAAAVAWSLIVGDRLDTSEVARMLGVTRQALAKRQRSGSLLGLRGRATTWFPVWQFDTRERCVRPVTADLIAAFREHLGDVDPVLVASWATTAQDEDLGGATPSEWIESRPDHRRMIESAHRATARLAQ